MRKVVSVFSLSLVLVLGIAGSAEARSERACVGAFVSAEAQEFGGVGEVVRQEAKDFSPFGNIVSAFATTCEFPEP